MTEIVSRLSFCRLQNCFALSGRRSGERTGTPMGEIIEEAINKYLEIIETRKKPKRVKKKKEILWDEKHRKNGEAKGTQDKEDR